MKGDRAARAAVVAPRRTVVGWTEVLLSFEEELAAAEALLRDGVLDGSAVADWAPPEDLGPLRPEHAAWARAVLARQRRVIAQLDAARAVARDRATYASAGGAPASRPAYVDARA